MGVVTATITDKAGKPMNPDFELLYLDVSKEFNKLPTAELKFIDGAVTENEFTITDSKFFGLGEKIKIALKYESETETAGTVFEGIVVNHGLGLDKYGSSFTVELCDEAIKMTTVRTTKVHKKAKKITDTEVIEAVIKNSGLTPGSIEKKTLEHVEMVQYYCSDWDFMLSRAEANGHLVLVNDGIVSTIKPEAPGKEDLKLELGKDSIYDFDLQTDARQQLGAVESKGWKIADKALSPPSKGTDYKLSYDEYTPEKMKTIATAVGTDKTNLVNVVDVPAAELKAWADAQLTKSRLSFFRGWIKVSGDATIQVGKAIKILGVGKRFTGTSIITAVRHQVAFSGWQTHIQIGMDANWFSGQSNIIDAKAAGLLPGVNGLQIGLVVAFKEDPEFRVQVNIPAFDDTEGVGVVWARLTTIDAGKDRGVFFRPEVGDEVVVGFLNDDPRQAIILGSVHSSTNKTPIVPDEKNFQKGIITKKKFRLLFDEEEEKIILSTSENNSIIIDEKEKKIILSTSENTSITIDENDKSIVIVDANKNKITMDSKGIVLFNKSKITIDTKDFALTATGEVKIEGKTVDII